MSGTLTVQLERPIKSARVLDDCSGDSESAIAGDMNPQANSEKSQQNLYGEVCRTVQGLVAKLNEFYDQIFAGHKEEIARLSIEIARKILMQKIEDGDYEIESIIKETLKNTPTHQDLIVHLNPEDLAGCQKAQQEAGSGSLAGIKLVADANIGRAECVLESPKGIIKSLIEEHLEQIGRALEKAE
jgi:flagellar biosynthesis/type III secretory pathway protein FliH